MRRVGIWERILRGCFSCATVSIDQRGLWKASARCCVGRLATAVLAVCPLASRWHCRCQEADQGTRFSLDWLSWEWCAMSTWHNSGSQQPRKTLPQSFFGGGSPWGACSAVPSTASKGVALALPITSAHSFICFIYVCVLWRSKHSLREGVLSTVWALCSSSGHQAWWQEPLHIWPS